MDDYDGTVWAITGNGTPASGLFEKVGVVITGTPAGPAGRVRIKLQHLNGVWLATAGAPTAVQFRGPRSTELADSFRFDRATESGAVPAGMASGDVYLLDVVRRPEPKPTVIQKAEIDPRMVMTEPTDIPSGIKAKALSVVTGASGGYARAKQLESWFQKGFYSDGGPNSGVAPGHSLARLEAFLANEQLVGNAEQYAAAMALMARTLGLPARVVMGFRPKVTGSGPVAVKGKDVDAWVEVAFSGGTWVPFFPTPDPNRKPDTTPKPQVQQDKIISPPTTASRRPSDDRAPAGSEQGLCQAPGPRSQGWRDSCTRVAGHDRQLDGTAAPDPHGSCRPRGWAEDKATPAAARSRHGGGADRRRLARAARFSAGLGAARAVEGHSSRDGGDHRSERTPQPRRRCRCRRVRQRGANR